MELRSQRECDNTREKLRLLEEHYERKRKEPADNAYVRELTLGSLKKTINQLKEEIARFECRRSTVSDDGGDRTRPADS
jgi:hypothetical protein